MVPQRGWAASTPSVQISIRLHIRPDELHLEKDSEAGLVETSSNSADTTIWKYVLTSIPICENFILMDGNHNEQ